MKRTYHTGEKARLHRSRKFNSLGWLIGTPLKILHGVEFQGGRHPDGEVKIIQDFPNTILLEMNFIASDWGLTLPARTILTQIPKASLACGDVKFRTMDGRIIGQDDVSSLGNAEYFGKEE